MDGKQLTNCLLDYFNQVILRQKGSSLCEAINLLVLVKTKLQVLSESKFRFVQI